MVDEKNKKVEPVRSVFRVPLRCEATRIRIEEGEAEGQQWVEVSVPEQTFRVPYESTWPQTPNSTMGKLIVTVASDGHHG